MTTILILEDERPSAERLIRQLRAIDPALQIAGPMESDAETREWLQTHRADIIMADIRLADGLSFDALEGLPADTRVIFTTAYDEYAIRAFKYNGVDYLLKPIDPDELRQAIARATRQPSAPDMLEALIETLNLRPAGYRQRFLIPCFDGYKSISVSDITHFMSENKATRLYLADGRTEPLALSLDELEQQLDPNLFFRANRQFILSVASIARISLYFGSKLKVHLKGRPDAEVIVSKEKAPRFKAWLDR